MSEVSHDLTNNQLNFTNSDLERGFLYLLFLYSFSYNREKIIGK